MKAMVSARSLSQRFEGEEPDDARARFFREAAGRLLRKPQALSIVARLAEALAYAHKQDVVHRDVKPADIPYDKGSDSVNLTDFGIDRMTDSSKTKTGLVLGVSGFRSPEQIAGKKSTGDLIFIHWASGCFRCWQGY